MFRTSDIVLIAVMVSAAAFTYKTKHEAEDRLADGAQDRAADPLRGRHDRPAARPTGACSPSRRGCRSCPKSTRPSSRCSRSRPTRSSASTNCRRSPVEIQDFSSQRLGGMAESGPGPDRNRGQWCNDRHLAQGAGSGEAVGRLDRRRGRAQGDRRQGEEPRRDDHGGVPRHLRHDRRAARLSRHCRIRKPRADRRAA